jgi:RHS repeat-associated protein
MYSNTENGITSYKYRSDGLRFSKTANGVETIHIWDGSNIIGDVVGGAVSATYVRGIGLIASKSGGTFTYYLFNGHGDTVQLTNSSGTVTKAYDYDAFGNERSSDVNDANPFRYCAEYFDKETQTIYLRARYYNPLTARMLSPDPHWNTKNMIYGDNPRKINERQDALGLNIYTYVPDITAIMQSGNLYAFCMNNPLMYVDPSGQIAYPGQIHNLVVNHVAAKHGLNKEQTIKYNNSLLWGRADLVSSSGEIWDVKRDKPGQIAAGVAQVLNYTQNTWKNSPNTPLSVGGYINPDSFVVTINIDTYYVSYRYAGNGVIAYDYYKVTNWQTVANVAVGIVVIAGITCAIILTDGAAAPVLVPLAAGALGG